MQERSSSLTHFLVLGALEGLLNQVAEHDPRARARLAALDGTVVRVRLDRPQLIFYVLVHADGIELMADFEGHVHVRIRAATGALIQWALAPNAPLPTEDRVRILGPEERIELLTAAVSEFSLWQLVRQWLDAHVRLNDLLTLVRREDPVWLERLHALPQQLDRLGEELAHQRLLQEDTLAALGQLRRDLRHAQKLDLLFLILALVLLFGAFATFTGQLPLVGSLSLVLQVVGLASLGLTLVASRLLAR